MRGADREHLDHGGVGDLPESLNHSSVIKVYHHELTDDRDVTLVESESEDRSLLIWASTDHSQIKSS